VCGRANNHDGNSDESSGRHNEEPVPCGHVLIVPLVQVGASGTVNPMRLYALVEADDPETIDLFLTRGGGAAGARGLPAERA
jgi:hypothetical protein